MLRTLRNQIGRLSFNSAMVGRNHPFRSVLVAAATLLLSTLAHGQAAPSAVAPHSQSGKSTVFDPHDLTGVWVRGKVPRGNATLSVDRPPMTPWGLAKFKTVKGQWGYNKAPGLAAPIAPEKEWNDPLLQCEPAGYPRVMLQIYAPLMRFMQTSNEIVEFFEWGHTYRDIWTDGRKPLESPEPTFLWLFSWQMGRRFVCRGLEWFYGSNMG